MKELSAAPQALAEIFIEPLEPSDFVTLIRIRHAQRPVSSRPSQPEQAACLFLRLRHYYLFFERAIPLRAPDACSKREDQVGRRYRLARPDGAALKEARASVLTWFSNGSGSRQSLRGKWLLFRTASARLSSSSACASARRSSARARLASSEQESRGCTVIEYRKRTHVIMVANPRG
jgi:hypothetical protein